MERPAKHLYGNSNRVSRSQSADRTSTYFSRDAIQRRVPVQKLMTVKPTRYPFKSEDGCPLGAPVFCGRAVGAESPQIVFQFLFAGWLWVNLADGHHELKLSRAGSEPLLARVPGGRVLRSVAAGGRAQSIHA